jgi:hypothetical protein
MQINGNWVIPDYLIQSKIWEIGWQASELPNVGWK